MAYSADGSSSIVQDPAPSWKNWAEIGVAGAGAALPLLAGGGHDAVSSAIAGLKNNANTAGDLSKSLTGEGSHVLQPLMDYLTSVTGGDRQALLQATMPERRRVIDQYATAKKSIAEFTPRSGGQAAAGAQLQSKEASDLAYTTATARQQGFTVAGNLGLGLDSAGLQALGLNASDLNAITAAEQKQAAERAQMWSNIGSAAGTIAGMYFGGPAGAAVGGKLGAKL